MSYLLTDHLGSTSIIADAGGALSGEQRYKAWGEVRYAAGVMPTHYTYTGQYSYTADFGLMFYNARWYDPAVGRFGQGDSVVPDPYNTQSWDRFAYTHNSPLRYIDPSGHKICYGMLSSECAPTQGSYGIIIKGDFTPEQKNAIHQAVTDVAYAIWLYTNYQTPWDAFRQVMGTVTFLFEPSREINGWAETVQGTIIYDDSINQDKGVTIPNFMRSIVHELGHVFDVRTGLKGSGDMWTTIYDKDGNYVTGINDSGIWIRTNYGYKSAWYPDQMHPADTSNGQQTIEEFADMFMNWVYDTFTLDSLGFARYDFMVTNMAEWIAMIIP